MSPSLETLRNKFEVYADVLSQASERRRSEQISQCGTIPTISCDKRVEMMEGLYHEDREERDKTRRLLNQNEEKLALDLSREVLELIKLSISPRRDFYATANLLLPELSEQIRKRDGGESAEGTPVDPIMDQMLNFLDFGREENVKDTFDEERELIDTVDRHKKNDNYAKQLHEEFTAIGETERHVREELWRVREAA
jgi:hypothetical protein